MRFTDIKTPSNLRMFIENVPGGTHFFSRKAMSFFGDTMRNFGVRRHLTGDGRLVIELYRRRPVKHGLDRSTYWAEGDDGTYAVQVRGFDPRGPACD